ncbi:MAG: hypothetical protein ACQEXX_01325 [Bacillota bacterium]
MEFIFEKNKLYDILSGSLVMRLKEHKAYIAGGTITSLFSNRPINDIDLYFRDEGSMIEFVEEIYDDNSDWVNVLTSKALLVRIEDNDVQMIHFRYFKDATEIFDTFDFTVCMGAFDFESEKFFLHEDFLKHNSQRILKFNKKTAFPIVSLLRVQKYKEKGYTISKPEFLRIALKCMDLKIDSADDLREHLGGMYGINYDKLIELQESEEFSFEKIIDNIAAITLSEDYFKKPKEVTFDSLDDIIEILEKTPAKVASIKDIKYRITRKGALRRVKNDPKSTEEINGKEYIEQTKFYKFVQKINNKYVSHWDRTFEYKIGELAIPKNEHLYFNEKAEIEESDYYNQGVLLEVIIPYEDFTEKQNEKVLAKKCFVVREVPKEEFMNWQQ